MQTALYVIWFTIPGFFFVMALWAFLESFSDPMKQESASDFFKQGLFILLCVFVAILIDRWALEPFATSVLQGFVPIGVLKTLLLPLLLLLGAKIIGPSAEIRITKAPRPSEGKAKSKPRRGAKS